MKKGDLVRYREWNTGKILGQGRYEWEGPGFLLKYNKLTKTATVLTKEGIKREYRASHVQKWGKRGVNPAEQP